jgi:hypothetical protein
MSVRLKQVDQDTLPFIVNQQCPPDLHSEVLLGLWYFPWYRIVVQAQ